MRKNTDKIGSWASLVLVVTCLAMITPLNVAGENLPPVANADPNNQLVYVGQTAWFVANMSYDPDGNITNITWDFGDGDVGIGMYVFHTYTNFGTYNVTLLVFDDQGASDTDTVIVKVKPRFIPLFMAQPSIRPILG